MFQSVRFRLLSGSLLSAVCLHQMSFSAKLSNPNHTHSHSNRNTINTNTNSTSPPHLVILGGSGFIGSHIATEALQRGCRVTSISRHGRPVTALINDELANRISWRRADILNDDMETLQRSLSDATAVISTVGCFGSFQHMQQVNGDANARAVEAACAVSVPRFVFLSVHVYPAWLHLPGYFSGKRQVERQVKDKFGHEAADNAGVVLQPSAVYGTRYIRLPLVDVPVPLPLWIVFEPLEMLTRTSAVQSFAKTPYIGSALSPILTPPVSVESVAKAAVDAAINENVKGFHVLTIDDIYKYNSGKPMQQ